MLQIATTVIGGKALNHHLMTKLRKAERPTTRVLNPVVQKVAWIRFQNPNIRMEALNLHQVDRKQQMRHPWTKVLNLTFRR